MKDNKEIENQIDNITEESAKEVADNVVEEVAEETAVKDADKVAEETARETAGEATDKVAKAIVEETVDKTVEETAEEAVEEKADKSVDEAVEDNQEKDQIKETEESEKRDDTEIKKVRTIHGHQIDLEEIKEKDEGLKFNSFKERLAYYWDYYKWTVGVAVVLGIIVLTLVRAVMIEMKPPIIYIAMMNAHMDSPGDATYGDDYGNQRGLNPKSGRIMMDTDFVHPMTVDDAALKNDTIIASMQRFTAAVTNSNIDIAITNPWVLKDYMENEIFYNLQEIYTAEEIKEFEDEDLLWYEKDSSEKLVPVGIKINGHRDIDSFYNGEVIVIGIPRDSKRVERAKDFVAWMLEE